MRSTQFSCRAKAALPREVDLGGEGSVHTIVQLQGVCRRRYIWLRSLFRVPVASAITAAPSAPAALCCPDVSTKLFSTLSGFRMRVPLREVSTHA